MWAPHNLLNRLRKPLARAGHWCGSDDLRGWKGGDGKVEVTKREEGIEDERESEGQMENLEKRQGESLRKGENKK